MGARSASILRSGRVPLPPAGTPQLPHACADKMGAKIEATMDRAGTVYLIVCASPTRREPRVQDFKARPPPCALRLAPRSWCDVDIASNGSLACLSGWAKGADGSLEYFACVRSDVSCLPRLCSPPRRAVWRGWHTTRWRWRRESLPCSSSQASRWCALAHLPPRAPRCSPDGWVALWSSSRYPQYEHTSASGPSKASCERPAAAHALPPPLPAV